MSSSVVIGSLIGQRYRVSRLLHEDAQVSLVEATHATLGEQVIVKILSSGVYDSRLSAKFVREARHAARIKSDHVARFVDAGTLDDGRPFIVMEHLVGEDLATIVARGPISFVNAIDWVLEACEGVAAAHSLGILHRDLNARSLFLAQTSSGISSIKVMGFGTARATDTANGKEEDAGLTVAGLGTSAPAYMAPELFIRATAPDASADVWSLGVILYELLSAQRPFGGSPEATTKGILVDAPPNPAAVISVVPQALGDIVIRCLEKRAEDRPESVRELAGLLAPFASPHGKALAARIVQGSAAVAMANLPTLPTASAPPEDEEEAEEGGSLHRRVDGGGLAQADYDDLRSRRPAAPESVTDPSRRSPKRVVPALLALLGASTALLLVAYVLGGARTSSSAAQTPNASTTSTAASAGSSESAPVAAGAPAAVGVASFIASAPPPSTPAPSEQRVTAGRPAGRNPSPPARTISPPATSTPKGGSTPSGDPWGWRR